MVQISYLTINDPLNTVVEINAELYAADKHENSLALFATETIEHPALIFETNDGVKRYYYRAIDWQKTLMIQVIRKGVSWYATDFRLDPSSDTIREIVGDSKLIYERV
jgi:hypothetical protein